MSKLRLYPCARYRAHVDQLQAEQKAVGLDANEQLLERDHTFCAFACNADPVAANTPDGLDDFWDCPCAAERRVRQPEVHKEILWKTAQGEPNRLLRVQALIELADMASKGKDLH